MRRALLQHAAPLLALLSLAPVSPTAGSAQSSPTSYHVIKRITLGKRGAGYNADFIVLDSVNRRLYGLGNTVLDIDRDEVVDSIPGPAAGGYALAPDVGAGLARNGTRFDLKTAKVLDHVAGTGDASVYDPVTRRAFMLDDTVTVVDMTNGHIIAKTHFGSKLESGVADGTGKLFINREDSSILTKVDARSLKIDARYPIANCKAAQGLAYDPPHRRLFLGCDKELVVVNAENGAVVARIPVVGHADEDAFDVGTQLAFNGNRPDSTLVLVHEDAPDHYSVAQTLKTGGGARAFAVDPKTHKAYGFYFDQPGPDRNSWVLMAIVLAP